MKIYVILKHSTRIEIRNGAEATIIVCVKSSNKLANEYVEQHVTIESYMWIEEHTVDA